MEEGRGVRVAFRTFIEIMEWLKRHVNRGRRNPKHAAIS